MDTLSPAERSRVMRKVKSKDTSPELRVRKALRELGVRYRLHDARLPGSPDVTVGTRRLAIFVHGCFWHSHPNCRRARVPRTRRTYWRGKLERNKRRDASRRMALIRRRWRVLTIWECQTRDEDELKRILARKLTRAQRISRA